MNDSQLLFIAAAVAFLCAVAGLVNWGALWRRH